MTSSMSVDEAATFFLEELAFRDYYNEFVQEDFQKNQDYWIAEIFHTEQIIEENRIDMEENAEILAWYQNITA